MRGIAARLPVPSELPWRRPRRELLLLALVAVAALTPLYGVNAQDISRLCLAQAVDSGHLYNDSCLSGAIDKSSYGGHLYSDKAPGMAMVEAPAVEAVGLPGQPWPANNLRLWGFRVLTAGLAFVVCAFLVGRVSEGLAPGFGAIVLVAFALGTLMAPFAAANFDHVPAAALGFGAFLLAWKRHPLLAGVVAGAAVFFEYETALVLAAVAVYVALAGVRPLARYAVGALPGLCALGAYNAFAFGGPWHFSYRYVANGYADSQASGFFGIGVPHLFSTFDVLAGSGGLLVVSPVLVAAGWGLVLLWRDRPAEAVLAAVVTVLFLFVNFGYFLPYGGVSPGPRFLIASLPFLAVGLGPAFARAPRTCRVLAAASILPTVGLTLVWAGSPALRQTVWGELARVPFQLGSSRFAQSLTPNVLDRVGIGRSWDAVLVGLAALTAFALAGMRVVSPRPRSGPRRRGIVIAVVLSAAAIAAADACAVFAYPYGTRTSVGVPAIEYLGSAILPSTTSVAPGQRIDFTVVVTNGPIARSDVAVVITVPPGMHLIGRPSAEGGGTCTRTATFSCALGTLAAGHAIAMGFAARVTQPGDHVVTAVASSAGVHAEEWSSITIHAPAL